MEKLLDQPCSSLSSCARYSSTAALHAISVPPSSARLQFSPYKGSSCTTLVSSSFSWEKKKRKKSTRKSDLLVPASVLTDERRKEDGGALTIFRDNLLSSFEQTNLCLKEGVAEGGVDATASRSAVTDVPMSRSDTPLLEKEDVIWLQMRAVARQDSETEPALASYLYSTILTHRSLERALAFHLGNKLSSATFLSSQLISVIIDTIMEDDSIRESIRADMLAVKDRDPACVSYAHCLLNFKGFLALQTHRVAHRLWKCGRKPLALAMQSRVSEVFHVDIHPAAVIGRGILFDHATGLVVGETATIGNNVSILHNVTLGGTGAVGGDRHPKIGDGVLIGAGAIILGNIKVGEGAKIGAGAVVVTDIPPRTTAVGNPARLVGGRQSPKEFKGLPCDTMDHTSFWSDYVI